MPPTTAVPGNAPTWKRTTTVFPAHMSMISTRRLEDYTDSFELCKIMSDAIIAHKGYYDEGMLHGDVCPANMLIIDVVGGFARGALLDLDNAIEFKKLDRATLKYPKAREAKSKDENKERDSEKTQSATSKGKGRAAPDEGKMQG